LSVLRVIDGSERLQPNPNGPLPAPESYDRARLGPNPDRPALVEMGIESDAVPVTELAENFSSMPLMAPPPFGSAIEGALG
jgi:hypothetical protein